MTKSFSNTDRLDSWKEIAAYLRRDVRTAIRWEKERGLPVHRVPYGNRQAVFAFRQELDLWLVGSYRSENGSAVPAESALDELDASSTPDNDMAPVSLISHQEMHTKLNRWFWQKRLGLAIAAVCATIILAGATKLWRLDSASLLATNPNRLTQSHQRILSPLLSDGVRILFPQYRNGRYDIGAVPVQGGSSTTIATNIANPELCALAPDGQSMLLRDLVHTRDALNPLYIQAGGNAAARVGDISAYDAAWYPDGKTILYSAGGLVYATDLSGTNRRPLFSVPGNAYWFKWSPDGKKVRFTVIDGRSEKTSIWEFAVSNARPSRLFPQIQDQVCCGSWTADGNFFIFQIRAKDAYEIWAQRYLSRHVSLVSNAPFPLVTGAVNYHGPLVSQDGRKLFVRAEAPKGELVKYNPQLRQFLSAAPGISVRTMAYSKDKNWIAYTSLDDNNLWRCREDGTQCIQLTRTYRQTVMPRWSPDGKTVAFMANSSGGTWEVYSVPADGGPATSLSHSDQATGYPDWSPDGEQLAFSNVPPVSQPDGIYVLNVRSGYITELPGSTNYSFPRWSPDGRTIVAVHAGDQHLYCYDVSTGKWRSLTTVSANYPSWSHNGKYVYFLSVSSPTRAIYRVTVADRSVEMFADLANVERGPFFFGDWIGLTPDDAPLAVRNSTIEDIYAWDLSNR